jgi:hypothetical protein
MENTMAATKRTASSGRAASAARASESVEGARQTGRPVNGANGAADAVPVQAGAARWASGPVAAGPLGANWLAPLQKVALQSAMLCSEALVSSLRDQIQTKNPLQMLSGGAQVLSSQLDAYLAQQSTWMQQLFDSEVLLNAQLFRQPVASGVDVFPWGNGCTLLDGWRQAQDEWVRLGRSWMEAGRATGLCG